jgi:hypothetical protein
MAICVEISLSLDICVKYAQFVKILLFLKCVQFMKFGVQFLMDTIQNMTIAPFLMKRKGDAHWLHVYHIRGKGRRALHTFVSHRRQWEMVYIGAHLPFT